MDDLKFYAATKRTNVFFEVTYDSTSEEYIATLNLDEMFK